MRKVHLKKAHLLRDNKCTCLDDDDDDDSDHSEFPFAAHNILAQSSTQLIFFLVISQSKIGVLVKAFPKLVKSFDYCENLYVIGDYKDGKEEKSVF